ncbi:MAG: phenylalanine--tRNA ligase subunit alpha [bacterium]
MEFEIQKLLEDALERIRAVATESDLASLKTSLIGKKGRLTEYFTKLRELPAEERPAAGAILNRAKTEIEKALDEREKQLSEEKVSQSVRERAVDITLPGSMRRVGRLHPITQVTNEIIEIFLGLGFDVVGGPEIETDFFNFEALNIHADHPARDEQDSFYLGGTLLLRTHTSPVQIKVMRARGRPPVQIIALGRTFRRDAIDASHSPVFHQVEGLMVDSAITMGHLKAVLEHFAREMFGERTRMRFRPDFFPFTEPSAEVAISCVICGGQGCAVCKRTGWLEILGAGMVHPRVLENGGFDPRECTGFAFGMGIERIAMLKYSIDDIRLFYENDVRFLRQF